MIFVSLRINFFKKLYGYPALLHLGDWFNVEKSLDRDARTEVV